MNQLTESINRKFKPQMAVVVYSDGNTSNGIYLEQRSIDKNGRMGAGRPLTKKCVTELVKAVAEETKELTIGYHGIIPRNLLCADTTTGRMKLVWYNPPQKRKHYFVKHLGIPDGEIEVPGLVYVVKDKSLYLYAFKGKTPKGKLYQAPFFNVNNGSVCLGNAKVKKPIDLTYEQAIKYWEAMFWQSEFSHLYGSNPVAGNLSTIVKECIKTGEPFPDDVLILSSTKLSDLLK